MNRKIVRTSIVTLAAVILITCWNSAAAQSQGPGAERLQNLLEKHPEADTDGDGILSRDEAKAFFQKNRGQGPGAGRGAADRGFGGPPGGFGPGPMRGPGMGGFGPGMMDRPDPEQLLKQHPEADTDGDGTLSPKEMRAFAQQQRTKMEQDLLAAHPELDTDKDGKLSPEEKRAGAQTIRDFMRTAMADQVLELHPEADLDGDGKLSEEEFRQFRAQQGPRGTAGAMQRPINWLIDNFDRVDLDGNGQLSKEELIQLRDRTMGPRPAQTSEDAAADQSDDKTQARQGKRARKAAGSTDDQQAGAKPDRPKRQRQRVNQ